MDPDRTGTLPFVWEPGFGFDAYVEYALDVPMYFLYREGVYRDATQQRGTFREFLEGRLYLAPGALSSPAVRHVVLAKVGRLQQSDVGQSTW